MMACNVHVVDLNLEVKGKVNDLVRQRVFALVQAPTIFLLNLNRIILEKLDFWYKRKWEVLN